jgi:gluconate kinase
MKRVNIFFGEMGCGKSYCAQKYAERHNFPFLEGDQFVTPEMAQRVSNFQSLNERMIDEYMEVLGDAISDRMEKMRDSETLIVAQALYRDQDRKDMKLLLESQGYEVRMWLVKVPLWRNIQNLLTRKDGWKWVLYWLLNKPFFQKPTHEHQTFYNIYMDK